MKNILRFHLIAAVVLLVVCAFTVPTYADTQSVANCVNCDGYTFQATLTPTGGDNYSLSFTITNVSGGPADAQTWSLTLFNPGDTVGSFSNFTMSDGNTAAYNVNVGKSTNGNANCNGAITQAVCINPSGSGTLSNIGVGDSLTFSFDFTCSNCTELANWIFLAQGSCDPGTGNCYAISTEGTPGTVPEPSSLVLFGSGLLAALGIMAIRRVRGSMFRRWDLGLRPSTL
jgi:PEP-CTERM motif-containing protein